MNLQGLYVSELAKPSKAVGYQRINVLLETDFCLLSGQGCLTQGGKSFWMDLHPGHTAVLKESFPSFVAQTDKWLLLDGRKISFQAYWNAHAWASKKMSVGSFTEEGMPNRYVAADKKRWTDREWEDFFVYEKKHQPLLEVEIKTMIESENLIEILKAQAYGLRMPRVIKKQEEKIKALMESIDTNRDNFDKLMANTYHMTTSMLPI